MGNRRKTDGKHMEIGKMDGAPMETDGKPAENTWKTNGKQMGHQWETDGKPTEMYGNRWKTDGTPMGNRRNTVRKHMDAYEKYLEYR